MSSEKNSLYNFILNIIEKNLIIKEDELISAALELGRDTSGLNLIKALSDLAYSSNQQGIGGILYSVYREADKRLSAGLEYYRLVSPQKTVKKPVSGLEDWRADSPVWANAADKETLLSGTKLQETEIDKILANELYASLYKNFWNRLFSLEDNIKQIKENKKYGWELRRMCLDLTANALYGAAIVQGEKLAIGQSIFYDKYILRIGSLNMGLETILAETEFHFSQGSKVINLQPKERVIILPNFKN